MDDRYKQSHEDDWYYVADGERKGPVQLSTLRQLRSAGTVTYKTLVWASHLEDWQTAGTVPDLIVAAQVGSKPPPVVKREEKVDPPSLPGPIETKTPPEFDSVEKAKVVEEVEEAEEVDGPSGVGGWLGFLTVALMFLWPLLGLGRQSADIREVEQEYPDIVGLSEWESYKGVSWTLLFVFAALSVYGGWGLAKGRDWVVVTRATAIIWAVIPGAVLADVLVASFFFGDIMDPTILGQLMGAAIAAGIWTAYLSKSKRVRNTYRG